MEKCTNLKCSSKDNDYLSITVMPINYHNKQFKPVMNSENGETSSKTIFHYKQHDQILTATYSGGQITAGHLSGLVDESGTIDMRYHQVNDKGILMTGKCKSTPQVLPDGRIRLNEKWEWTSGDLSSGESVIEEIK